MALGFCIGVTRCRHRWIGLRNIGLHSGASGIECRYHAYCERCHRLRTDASRSSSLAMLSAEEKTMTPITSIQLRRFWRAVAQLVGKGEREGRTQGLVPQRRGMEEQAG